MTDSTICILTRLMVIVLCLCVTMQVLGAPVTLWFPSMTPDTVSASILEGFSIPPSLPQLDASSSGMLAHELTPCRRVSLVDHSLFHPPCPVL